jgi:hypothetical protein
VRQTADDLRVPVRVGNGELAPGLSHGDLLRVRFDAPGTHRAFLALVDPHLAAGPASLEMAELGVVLASAAATPEGWRDLRGPVPLRAFVDADRLPTNASRSLVRMEEAPIAGLVDRLPIRRLVERLVELLAAGDGGLRLRQAAVALLAAHVGGPDWRERLAKLPETVAEQLAPLLDHLLLRDALGRSRSPAASTFSAARTWSTGAPSPWTRSSSPSSARSCGRRRGTRPACSSARPPSRMRAGGWRGPSGAWPSTPGGRHRSVGRPSSRASDG